MRNSPLPFEKVYMKPCIVSKYLPINVVSMLRVKVDGKNSKYSFYIEYIALLTRQFPSLVTVQ